MHRSNWRHRLYEILEQGSAEDAISIAINRVLIALIVVTVIATVLESEPALAAKYGAAFQAIEVVAIAAAASRDVSGHPAARHQLVGAH
jgi:voltage-gated potassium channel